MQFDYEYHTVTDKAAWGEGPWVDEPDKAQWTDEATGLPCLLKRARIGRAVVEHRDAMVATVSFLDSVIRGREPYTPDVAQAVANFYTRWERIIAAGEVEG